MTVRKQDAHRALELLEEYRKQLSSGPENRALHEALTKAIVAIRSRLFQALLDIQEFYVVTLEDSNKSPSDKTEETLKLAQRWEQHPPPIPVDVKQRAQKSLSPQVEAQKAAAAYSGEEWVTETVEIDKGPSGGLGISIAGGYDNRHVEGSEGIYVTKVIPNTAADRDGRIQLGDQVVSVNGASLEYVTHQEAVQTLKETGQFVKLVLRRKVGREWTPVDSMGGTIDRKHRVEQVQVPSSSEAASSDKQPTLSPNNSVNVTLTKNEKGLGFSIAGGRGNQHVLGDDGIFITKIISEGAAEEDGRLEVGDRILQVNSHSMVDVTHDEGVKILRGTDQTVVIHVEKQAYTHVGSPSSDKGELHESIKPYVERTVELTRPKEGLGFNIVGGEGGTGIFISLLAVGGIARQSKMLAVGDQILKVNDTDIMSMTHEEAATVLKNAGDSVKLLVEYKPDEFSDFQAKLQRLQEPIPDSPSIPVSTAPEPTPIKTTEVVQLYVRALFEYDASKDDDRPSQGLSFKHGDILHVLNGSDKDWWQAALVTGQCEDGQQGLIPSKQRIERRSRTNQKTVKFTKSEDPSPDRDRRFSARKTSFKLSKKLPFIKKVGSAPPQATDDSKAVEDNHVPTYEAVSLQRRGYARPVIILGPLKEEINDMLVQEFPDQFAGCVPHTTRPARDGEVDGRDYHFVQSVDDMERDIKAHLFIEAGRYKENLYGTSIKAVQEVAAGGKHCILGVSGYAIRRLQMADLHPIAICIRPVNPEVIRAARAVQGEEDSPEVTQQMFDKGQKIEEEFAEYFTAVVEGSSLQDLYSKVEQVIRDQSGNFIWIPTSDPPLP